MIPEINALSPTPCFLLGGKMLNKKLAEGQIWHPPPGGKPGTAPRPTITILGFAGDLVQWSTPESSIHCSTKWDRMTQILTKGCYTLEPVSPFPGSTR